MILKGRFCLPCYPDLSCPRWLPQSITWTSQLLTSNKKESETSSEACDVGAYGQKKVGGRTDLWSDWRGRLLKTLLFRPLNKAGCDLQIFILSMYNYCNAHIFEYIRIISANATVFWTHMCYRLKFIIFVETLSSFQCYCQSSFFLRYLPWKLHQSWHWGSSSWWRPGCPGRRERMPRPAFGARSGHASSSASKPEREERRLW